MDGYFEDFSVGQTFVSPGLTITEEAITQFARQYDPQVFHLDPEIAELSTFGRLIASGWQTAAYTMRMLVEGGAFGSKGAIGVAVDDLRWHHPVSASDRLHVYAEVESTRASATRPIGIIRMKIITRNQDQTDVMSQVVTIMVPRRS